MDCFITVKAIIVDFNDINRNQNKAFTISALVYNMRWKNDKQQNPVSMTTKQTKLMVRP